MKKVKFEIILVPESSGTACSDCFEKVCRFLLQKYCEGCEECEGFGVFEGIYGGAGGKRFFNTGPEGGMYK